MSIKQQDKQIIDNKEKASEMVSWVFQNPVSFIGISSVYSEGKWVMFKGEIHSNPHAISPHTISLSFAQTTRKETKFNNYVLDLRKKSVWESLLKVLKLPIPFVGHDLKPILFCLWKKGIQTPRTVWDSLIFEKLSNRRQEQAYSQYGITRKEDEAFWYSLHSICHMRGVPHQTQRDEAIIRESIAKAAKRALESCEFNFAIKDAEAAAQLYLLQVKQAVKDGTLQHLVSIEMPFVATNARMEWDGVRVANRKANKRAEKYRLQVKKYQKRASKQGLSDLNCDYSLKRFLKDKGVGNILLKKDSFKTEDLKKIEAVHKVMPSVIKYRKYYKLSAQLDALLALVHESEFAHPTYNQLGTKTGRLTSTKPNIIGLNGKLRRYIIPREGYGIRSVDWSQMEPGIVAAMSGDEKLLGMFNAGDVYSEMARQFYKKKLPKKARKLSDEKFKAKYGAMRQTMKECMIGIIYGKTPFGIARDMGCSIEVAQRLFRKFTQMFPDLAGFMLANGQTSGERGYSSTVTNVHCHRGATGPVSDKEIRSLANHTIQGTGAAIFKSTANKLTRLYEAYDARIIVPMHDEFVFEAPEDRLQEVAKLTARVMRETMREFFPELRPKAEIAKTDKRSWGN